MNMWGFTPAVFPQVERLFMRFLQKYGAEPKREFYIPSAVNTLLVEKSTNVKVLRTTDSWFGMTLLALNKVPATLRSLGLPERCEAFVGKNWYTPGMQPPPCPEIFRLHRFQMVWLLLKEPAALWRILKQAIPSTRPFVVFYGQVEGRNFGHIEDEGARFASLGKFFGELASPVYVLLFVTALVGGLLSLLLLMDGRSELCLSFSVFLNAVIVATLIVCLLGDGYADLARHFHIGQSALLIAPVVSLVVVTGLLSELLKRARPKLSEQAR